MACLAPETRIETREGIKVITEVAVGDEVLTHTGQYRPGQGLCAGGGLKETFTA